MRSIVAGTVTTRTTRITTIPCLVSRGRSLINQRGQKEKWSKSKERKKRKGQCNEGSVCGEVRELKKIIHTLSQKVTASTYTSRGTNQSEEDIIPLYT